MNLLSVKNLCLQAGGTAIVEALSFAIAPGEILAIAGQTGSGKTLTALSMLNLLPVGITRKSGDIVLDGVHVPTATRRQLQALRGGTAGMVFQEPMSSLNPLMRAGQQVAEAIRLHAGTVSREHVHAVLRAAGLQNLPHIASAYPHQLSGGERQRVMIAIALANQPRLLIADEPTSALDGSLARQILELIGTERRARGLSVLWVTHDIAQIRRYADRVLVLHEGRTVEYGNTGEIFRAPKHRPTSALFAPAQLAPLAAPQAPGPVILKASALTVELSNRGFGLRPQTNLVLDRVSLEIAQGETLGIIGGSGAGKSTLALALLNLIRYRGDVLLNGQNLRTLNRKTLRGLRRQMQIIFQDPYGSLAPRMTAGEIIGEGLRIHAPHLSRAARDSLIETALREVLLPASTITRYPHEFSGGQRQRIAIARALILQPTLLILDEPTSALDAGTRAEILTLLQNIQQRRSLAYLLISHDLNVVHALAHRVMVLREGRLEEVGKEGVLF